MKKFYLAFLTVAVMMLSSCSNTSADPEQSKSSEDHSSVKYTQVDKVVKGIAITQADVKLKNDSPIDYSSDFEGKIVVNFMNQTLLDWDHEYVWNEINKYLCDNGYDFIINYIPYDYTESPLDVYEEYCSDGIQIDIIDTGSGYYDEETGKTYNQTVNTFIEKGYLTKLDDMLKDDDTYNLYEMYPEWYWQRMIYDDGNIYCKPVDNMSGFTSSAGVSVNNELAEKYSYDINNFDIMKADEILKKVADNESVSPLRTTIKFHANADEYGESTADFYAKLAGFQLVDQTVALKDNTAVNMFAEEETLKLLEKLHDYHNKGYYEYFDNSDGFSDGSFFAQLTGLDGVTKLHIYYSDFSYVDTDFKTLSYVYMDKFYGNSGIGISAKSENPEIAFEALCVLNCDPEIAKLLKYGIEGRNYFYYDEYSKLDGSDKNVDELYKSNNYPIVNTAYPMSVDYIYNDDIVDVSGITEKENRTEWIKKIRNSSVYYPRCEIEINDKALKQKAQAVRDIYDEYSGLWLGEYDDVSDTLDEMNEKLNNAGMQDLIDYFNGKNDG